MALHLYDQTFLDNELCSSTPLERIFLLDNDSTALKFFGCTITHLIGYWILH